MAKNSSSRQMSMAGATDQKAPIDVQLPTSLKQLLYFNGRFMTADDMNLEQQNLLLRHQLAEQALGPGVSNGLYVNIDKEMKVLYITGGHASDGLGQDLLLRGDIKGKLVQIDSLWKAYELSPKSTKQAGPAITPDNWTPVSTAPTYGMFLLTASKYQKPGPGVEQLGSQCADISQQCQAGSQEDGVSLQLVYFASATGFPDQGRAQDLIGWGARAYFQREQELFPSVLNRMNDKLSDGGLTPLAASFQIGNDTHVPLAALYLVGGGTCKAVDVWTVRRLRAPVESTYWLSSLLQPPQTAQLARTIQFQNQVAQVFGTSSQPTPVSLWTQGNGFSLSGSSSDPVKLPGCGFLPVRRYNTDQNQVDQKKLIEDVEKYLSTADGKIVPYDLRPVTPGEMNSLFKANLSARELPLKPVANNANTLAQEPKQVTVWYASPWLTFQDTDNYFNFVMFTWPTQRDLLTPRAEVQQSLSLCLSVLGTHPLADLGSNITYLHPKPQEGRDDEWIGLTDSDAARPQTAGGIKYTAKLPITVKIRHVAEATADPPILNRPVFSPDKTSVALTVRFKVDADGNGIQDCLTLVNTINGDVDWKNIVEAIVSKPKPTAAAEFSLLGRMNDLLSQFNVMLSPNVNNVSLSYQTARIERGTLVGGFVGANGQWNEGSMAWASAGKWCEGLAEADELGQDRSRIHGIRFRLQGEAAKKYVVRYKVAGKLIDPNSVVATPVIESDYVNSTDGSDDENPPFCSVYPNVNNADGRRPIHRIFVKILPRCSGTFGNPNPEKE